MALAQNHLIELLAKARGRLLALADHVQLAQSEVLGEVGEATRYVYFPINGFVSLVTSIDSKPVLEVGMVGREGLLGAQAALGVFTHPMHFGPAGILLAEDSDADAEMLIRTIRRGDIVNPILRVRDGVEALDYLFLEGRFEDRGGGLPDLILLDLKMPQLDGVDVLRRLRERDLDFIPVVMLITFPEERGLVESYDFQADYLIKPVTIEAFAEVLRRVGIGIGNGSA